MSAPDRSPLDAVPGDVIDLTASDVLAVVRPEMTVPFVDLASEHHRYRHQLDAAVAGVVDASSFVLGEAVERFERSFAAYCSTEHAVGVDSGFSALELILRGYGIGPGDEVITTANTFVATVAAIDATGATPVLVDVDPATHWMDLDQTAAAITAHTRAIIPVHLYGRVGPMDPLLDLARYYGVKVIEDACQAHGAAYRGRRAGSLGDAAAFSFYPSKNLGAFGDGGMIVTDDADLVERLRMLRNVGSTEKYVHAVRGFNRRLDSIHAAVLDIKLGYLDRANEGRRRAAAAYTALLEEAPVTVPAKAEADEHVFHLYVIETLERDGLMRSLGERGISVGIHYPVPVHLQPAYGWLGHGPGDFPVSEALAERIVSLPMFPTISVGQIAYVVKAIERYFQGVRTWT